jgi:hypothetical protein
MRFLVLVVEVLVVVGDQGPLGDNVVQDGVSVVLVKKRVPFTMCVLASR